MVLNWIKFLLFIDIEFIVRKSGIVVMRQFREVAFCKLRSKMEGIFCFERGTHNFLFSSIMYYIKKIIFVEIVTT